MTGALPELQLPLCDRCALAVRNHGIVEAVIASVGAILGVAGAALCFSLRPWLGWPWLSVSCAVFATLALGLRLLRARACIGETGWQGPPARWTRRVDGTAELETPSVRLRDTLLAATVGPPQIERCIVKERDGRTLGLVVAFLVAVVAPALWTRLHPVIRVINLGARPISVVVDGRVVGFLPPSWTEAPNGGLSPRVPIGWRLFEARDDQGERVDHTRGWIPGDSPVLYAPAHEPFCVWIEQRAYGKAAAPRPAVLRLPSDQSLYELPGAVDSWFQPNPASTSGDRWFSGGIRRALRHGPCLAAPRP